MKQSLTSTIQTLMFALITCLTIKTNSAPIKTTTAQYSYNTLASINNQFKQQYASDMIIPVSSSTTQKTIKKSQKKSKSSKNKKFKNYAYVKGGIARTRYNKFKEGDKSIYVTKKPDIGLLYLAGIGHKFTKSIRGDISLQYGQLKYKGKDDEYDLRQKIRLFSALANGYYDITIKNSFLVYLTAGLGVGYNRTSNLNDISPPTNIEWKGKNTTNLVWNLGTGIIFGLTKRFSLDIGYRYLNSGKVKLHTHATSPMQGKPKTQKITAHQILGALIYNF